MCEGFLFLHRPCSMKLHVFSGETLLRDGRGNLYMKFALYENNI